MIQTVGYVFSLPFSCFFLAKWAFQFPIIPPASYMSNTVEAHAHLSCICSRARDPFTRDRQHICYSCNFKVGDRSTEEHMTTQLLSHSGVHFFISEPYI